MTNDFVNSPSVGSHDAKPSYEELQARVIQLEQRLDNAEKEQASQKSERKPKKKWMKVVGKFFQTFIKPILDFLPKLLNSIANLKSASKKVNTA
jgi:hypothetical protein